MRSISLAIKITTLSAFGLAGCGTTVPSERAQATVGERLICAVIIHGAQEFTADPFDPCFEEQIAAAMRNKFDQIRVELSRAFAGSSPPLGVRRWSSAIGVTGGNVHTCMRGAGFAAELVPWAIMAIDVALDMRTFSEADHYDMVGFITPETGEIEEIGFFKRVISFTC